MTHRLPPAGSLKEALLLTVWLRRQEAEAQVVKVLATAGMTPDNATSVGGAFKEYWGVKFPFAAKVSKMKDREMTEMMKREIAQGPLRFTPTTPLRDRARAMAKPTPTQREVARRMKR
jgi:hypothetical protein